MNFLKRMASLEPAVLRGVIISAVWVVTSFGIAVSPQIPDSLIALSAALLALAQAFWTRPAVTANDRVAVYVPDPVNAPEVVKAGNAITTATPNQIYQAATTGGDVTHGTSSDQD